MGHYDRDYDHEFEKTLEREQATRKKLFNVMETFSNELYRAGAERNIPRRFLENLTDMMNDMELKIIRNEK